MYGRGRRGGLTVVESGPGVAAANLQILDHVVGDRQAGGRRPRKIHRPGGSSGSGCGSDPSRHGHGNDHRLRGNGGGVGRQIGADSLRAEREAREAISPSRVGERDALVRITDSVIIGIDVLDHAGHAALSRALYAVAVGVVEDRAFDRAPADEHVEPLHGRAAHRAEGSGLLVGDHGHACRALVARLCRHRERRSGDDCLDLPVACLRSRRGHGDAGRIEIDGAVPEAVVAVCPEQLEHDRRVLAVGRRERHCCELICCVVPAERDDRGLPGRERGAGGVRVGEHAVYGIDRE